MSKPERIISRVLAVIGVLQMLALIPSAPFIFYAARRGPPALLSGDFSYWPVRDSVVAVLDVLLLAVTCGYAVVAVGLVASRRFRLWLWAASAAVYLLFPIAHVLDPRPVPLPSVVAHAVLSYLIFMSLLSASAFYFARHDAQPNVA